MFLVVKGVIKETWKKQRGDRSARPWQDAQYLCSFFNSSRHQSYGQKHKVIQRAFRQNLSLENNAHVFQRREILRQK